jgi:demethylmenaquinone methyltransferase/2-methoxy-6-polyprenyl-1,4-benzoquinol methylase
LFFELWFDHAVPTLGRIAGDAQAYNYLPSSVRRFPGPQELAAAMAAAGMRDIHYLVTAGGIIALHVGVVR